MPTPPRASSPSPALLWQGERRRLRDPRLDVAANLDLDDPTRGVRPHGDEAADTLLGVELRGPFHLADHWIRAGDAAAIYESADERRLRVTAMWRLHAGGGRVRAWELILSAQTALLHSDPRLVVVSRVAGGGRGGAARCAWGHCEGDGVVWRDEASPQAAAVLVVPGDDDARGGAGGAESVVVVGHPGEVERLAVRHDAGDVVVEAWLFAGDLEKGVLLRGRVLAAIGPAATARTWAGDLALAFAGTAPMLST